MSTQVRRAVAVVGGLLAGSAAAKGYESSSGGSSELALMFLGIGLGVGLMFAALVR